MDSGDEALQMSAELALAGAVLPGLLQHAEEASILDWSPDMNGIGSA